VLPRLEEHRLGDVFGGLAVARHPHRHAEDDRGVLVVEVGEGRVLAGEQPAVQPQFRFR